MLKTSLSDEENEKEAYHLGEGRMLKTIFLASITGAIAYHLGEGRMLKTASRIS